MIAPPLVTDFITIATAMGAVPQPRGGNRLLIWGYYGDGTNWAFTFGPNPLFTEGWNFEPATNPDGSVDAGAFLVKISSVSETPLPGALALFASGGALLGFLGWRRKRKA